MSEPFLAAARMRRTDHPFNALDHDGHNGRYWKPKPGGIAERALNVMKAQRRTAGLPTEIDQRETHPAATARNFEEKR
jgi:hypothetical protein